LRFLVGLTGSLCLCIFQVITPAEHGSSAPHVTSSERSAIMPLEESTWISEHQDELEEYAGKWIAVLKGRVLASGHSVVEVMEKVAQQTSELPLVVKMPRKDENLYVFNERRKFVELDPVSQEA